MKQNEFQATVITKLEYIESNQQKHDDLFKDVYKKIECDRRRIDKAEGFAKGAMAVSSTGILASIINFIRGGI